jgi:CBS domain-containing protein
MMNHRGITERALETVESGLEKGREAIGAIVPMATQMIRPARRRRWPEGPMWFGLGVAVAGALVLASRWRLRSSRGGAGAPDAGDGRRLRDVMVTDVHAIEPATTVVNAAEQMHQRNVGALPIVDHGVVVGIVTDRDLVVRVLARRGVEADAMRVTECATKNPVLGRPDWTVERALIVMAQQQVGRLPVVDDQGRLLGIVTLSSLALRSQRPDETLAAARKVSLRSARTAAASR